MAKQLECSMICAVIYTFYFSIDLAVSEKEVLHFTSVVGMKKSSGEFDFNYNLQNLER